MSGLELRRTHAAGPYGSLRIESMSLTRAQWRRSVSWFSRSRLLTIAPYSPFDFGDPRVDDDIARVGRAGSAPDIAPAALFLCSDGARWINGANLPVDGGLEASINATVLGF